MPKFGPEQQGLKTKLLMDRLKAKLDETQAEGEERIVFLVHTLLQELKDQGYEIKTDSQLIYIHLYLDNFYLNIEDKQIKGRIDKEEEQNG